jgi:hypothetical protein
VLRSAGTPNSGARTALKSFCSGLVANGPGATAASASDGDDGDDGDDGAPPDAPSGSSTRSVGVRVQARVATHSDAAMNPSATA